MGQIKQKENEAGGRRGAEFSQLEKIIHLTDAELQVEQSRNRNYTSVMHLRLRYPSITTMATDLQCTKKSRAIDMIRFSVRLMTAWSVSEPAGMAITSDFRPLPESTLGSLERDTVPIRWAKPKSFHPSSCRNSSTAPLLEHPAGCRIKRR